MSESKPIAGSRHTQSRRWAAQHDRQKLGAMTEFDVNGKEARAAVSALLAEGGHKLLTFHGYDKHRDLYVGTSTDTDGRVHDYALPGEGVGRVVNLCRMMVGTKKPLIRKSELLQKHTSLLR